MKKSTWSIDCVSFGLAIQWLRSGSTVLPSSEEVTVKLVSLLPASADETATTPASNASERMRARMVIWPPSVVARTTGMVGGGCCRDVEIALQKCLGQGRGVPGPRPGRGPDRRPGAFARRPEAARAAGAAPA